MNDADKAIVIDRLHRLSGPLFDHKGVLVVHSDALLALVADRPEPDPYLAKCADLIATLRQIGEMATAAANKADFQNVPPPPEPPK